MFSSMRVVKMLLDGLVEPIATRLLTAKPLVASNEPGEFAAGRTPKIFFAAGSMRPSGILLPSKGRFVRGSYTFTLDPEKSPLRNAALGTVQVLKNGEDWRRPSQLQKKND